jgi:hypothetical protein
MAFPSATPISSGIWRGLFYVSTSNSSDDCRTDGGSGGMKCEGSEITRQYDDYGPKPQSMEEIDAYYKDPQVNALLAESGRLSREADALKASARDQLRTLEQYPEFRRNYREIANSDYKTFEHFQ